jgi:orotidine-5'-phosphate decarboxylase
MKALQKLQSKFENGFHICVGLDTDIKKIPQHLLSAKDPILEFNKIIIEQTFQHAAAYKINFAFYEVNGTKGFDYISKTLELIPSDVLTIADAKRGDIGNTSQMYAQSIFQHLNFDSVTLHPYMGFDSLNPFLEYENKINFILALTSNKSSEDFEKQKMSNGQYLFQHIIEKVNQWNTKNNCGIVFGATNIQELKENLASFNSMPVLVPGVGVQGGSLEDVTEAFLTQNNKNFLINMSRAILYADNSKDFGKVVSQSIKDFNSVIQSYK